MDDKLLLGVWRYLSTDIPSDRERSECVERLARQIEALISADWSIPGEGEKFNRGSMLAEDGLEGPLAAVHIAVRTDHPRPRTSPAIDGTSPPFDRSARGSRRTAVRVADHVAQPVKATAR